MSGVIPYRGSVTVTPLRVLLDTSIPTEDDVIVVDSGNVDAGSPTSRFREGNVVVLRTSTGRYVEANDTNGDRNTAASITSSGHTDGNGVIKIVGNHGTFSVTTTTGSGTEANNATDLNADADFAAHYTASSAGGELTIASNAVGGEEWFYVHSDTMATASFSEGEANGVVGATADYRVTLDRVDLVDPESNAVHATTRGARKGNFDTSNLQNLTAEAKATLRARGAQFD